MYCACGCGKMTKENNKCLYGHSPLKHLCHYKGRDKWIIENTNKHLCQCGCGSYIVIKKHHFSMGIPQYILGHHSYTDKYRVINSERASKRLGELSPRWKEDRNSIRGRKRAIVDFTKRQKRDIYIRDNGVCQNCKIICLLDVGVNHPYKVNFDHIIAIKDGGNKDIENGQVLCLSCHKLKHSDKANRVNSVKPLVGNTEPSRGIANRLTEGVETRSEETIMTMTPYSKEMI